MAACTPIPAVHPLNRGSHLGAEHLACCEVGSLSAGRWVIRRLGRWVAGCLVCWVVGSPGAGCWDGGCRMVGPPGADCSTVACERSLHLWSATRTKIVKAVATSAVEVKSPQATWEGSPDMNMDICTDSV